MIQAVSYPQKEQEIKSCKNVQPSKNLSKLPKMLMTIGYGQENSIPNASCYCQIRPIGRISSINPTNTGSNTFGLNYQQRIEQPFKLNLINEPQSRSKWSSSSRIARRFIQFHDHIPFSLLYQSAQRKRVTIGLVSSEPVVLMIDANNGKGRVGNTDPT